MILFNVLIKLLCNFEWLTVGNQSRNSSDEGKESTGDLQASGKIHVETVSILMNLSMLIMKRNVAELETSMQVVRIPLKLMWCRQL